MKMQEKNVIENESGNEDGVKQTSIETIESEDKMDTMGAIVVEQLMKRLDELQILFEQKIQRNECEEKILDQMHKELQQYKDDMYAKLVRPILLDITEVRDSILRMADAYKVKEEKGIPLDIFSTYAMDLLDILEKNQVRAFQAEERTAFQPAKQRAIKKQETDQAELHGKIAKSVSEGYEYNGQVLVSEKVIVYVQTNTRKEGNV